MRPLVLEVSRLINKAKEEPEPFHPLKTHRWSTMEGQVVKSDIRNTRNYLRSQECRAKLSYLLRVI